MGVAERRLMKFLLTSIENIKRGLAVPPGTPHEIVVMGAIMECAKLVACGWLAGAWRHVPLAFRGVLMVLIAGLAARQRRWRALAVDGRPRREAVRRGQNGFLKGVRSRDVTNSFGSHRSHTPTDAQRIFAPPPSDLPLNTSPSPDQIAAMRAILSHGHFTTYHRAAVGSRRPPPAELAVVYHDHSPRSLGSTGSPGAASAG
jgi:hypothetical protein